MLLFMGVVRLPRDLHEVLVVHGYQMIQQGFAGLQEKAQHERIALVIRESPEIFGTITFSLLEEVVEKRGGEHLVLEIVDPRCGDSVIPLQVGLYRGDRGGGRVFFEVVKGRALLAIGDQQQLVNGLAQLRDNRLKTVSNSSTCTFEQT